MIPRKSDVSYKTQGDFQKEAIVEAIESGVGQEGIRGTVWGFINGVTYWLDHQKEYTNTDKKLDSIWFGRSSKMRQSAFDLCLLEIQ